MFIILLCTGGVALLFLNTPPTQEEVTTHDREVDGPGESLTLPYSNSLYTITETDKSTLLIKAYSGYRNAAVNRLYEFGLDPVDYKITFNYRNPFKDYVE